LDDGLISHADLACQWKALPVFKRGNQPTIAIINPLDMGVVDKLGESPSLTIHPSCPVTPTSEPRWTDIMVVEDLLATLAHRQDLH